MTHVLLSLFSGWIRGVTSLFLWCVLGRCGVMCSNLGEGDGCRFFAVIIDMMGRKDAGCLTVVAIGIFVEIGELCQFGDSVGFHLENYTMQFFGVGLSVFLCIKNSK